MKYSILRALFILIIATCFNFSVYAQSAYTLHTIVAGENLSALAKTYHTTVGDIMRMNGMHSDSKLQIGEKIKIPATSSPVPAPPPVKPSTETAPKKEALTHTVQSGESLYRISKTYKIPVEKLMTLNNIANAGDIKVGQVLLVSNGTPPEPVKTRTVQPATDSQQQVIAEKQPAEQPQQMPPATHIPVNSLPVNNTNTTIAEPSPALSQNNNIPVNSDNNIIPPTTQPVSTGAIVPTNEGFFTTQFRQNVEGRNEQTKTGASMTFKSASGWADKKFYVLMNEAPPGSIVKLANGNTIVYAKVLWSLGSQKENEGLDFRISTAAAAALNISDEKFNITVTYFQ